MLGRPGRPGPSRPGFTEWPRRPPESLAVQVGRVGPRPARSGPGPSPGTAAAGPGQRPRLTVAAQRLLLILQRPYFVTSLPGPPRDSCHGPGAGNPFQQSIDSENDAYSGK